MSHPTPADETNPPLRKGDYHPAASTDLRSPCPVINALANHGYIARSGRNIRANDLRSAMSVLGISLTLRYLLTSVAYLEHIDPSSSSPSSSGDHKPHQQQQQAQPTLLARLWAFILNPLGSLFGNFALRTRGQLDKAGLPVLNLDELSRHNAVEHDVSMTRRDFFQKGGDNHSAQPDLVASLLNAAHNGTDITVSDWAHFRVKRIAEQTRDNPTLDFGAPQDKLGLAETAFLQRVFGERASGWAVPVGYMRALFAEERLPVQEGWRRRSWWSVGIVELTAQGNAFGKLVEGVKRKVA